MNVYGPDQLNSVETARQLIGRWTGFELRPSTPHRIYTLLEGRCAALNCTSVDAYLHTLSNLASTDDEPQRLINLITNGLTAFWRDDAQLETLRTIMTDIADPQRPLQIWCAGCSTGEEPFTVAMLARESGIDARILGTDVNTDFLDHARRGIYGPWSLRRLSLERQQRFFRPHDAQSWKIHPELQSIVAFQQHNLLDPLTHVPDVFERREWDIILCRNVLIYLTAEASEKAYHHFSNALTPNGYLLLSSSEQITGGFSTDTHSQTNTSFSETKPCFQPVRSGESFVYRRCPTSHKFATLQNQVHATSPTLNHGFTFEQDLTGDNFDTPPIPPPMFSTDGYGLEEATSEIEDTHTVANLLMGAARYLQNAQFDAAITNFEAVLSYDPFIPEAHCLMGTALVQSGAFQLAGDAFRKALFLDPHNWFAAYQMADLMTTIDAPDAARQAWRQTLEGLNAIPDPLADAYILLQFMKPLAEYRDTIRKRANAYLKDQLDS